jgi:hypothetical protein
MRAGGRVAKEIIRRRAADNEYLHSDFHGALSTGIEYLDRTYGEEAVREYLRQFAAKYYAPLARDINRRGLVALREHFETIYGREGGRIRTELTEDELLLEVEACPAVTHMRDHGYSVARSLVETERTVNAALCEGTPFEAELLEYDPQTGHSIQRFRRRAK